MKNLFLALILGICSMNLYSQTFTLKSNDVQGQVIMKQVFNSFGCSGDNISPQLSWINPPEGTKSFAITMYDPDAPTGSGWWHWIVFNIPASAREFVEKAGDPDLKLAPQGTIQSLNDFGDYGYGGPCPPEGGGIHEYIITIYALKTNKLDLNKDSNPALVGFNINANTIEKASIVMYYQR